MGSIGAGKSTETVSSPRTITNDEVMQHPLYRSITENVESRTVKTLANTLTRAVLRRPEEGSVSEENYEFYNLSGREFNTIVQNMAKKLRSMGYDVEVTTWDRKEGGEYRLRRGYGFKRTPVKHYSGKEISWKRRNE